MEDLSALDFVWPLDCWKRMGVEHSNLAVFRSFCGMMTSCERSIDVFGRWACLQRQDPQHSRGLSYSFIRKRGSQMHSTDYFKLKAYDFRRNSKTSHCKTSNYPSLSLSLYPHLSAYICIYLQHVYLNPCLSLVKFCLSFKLCFGRFRKGPRCLDLHMPWGLSESVDRYLWVKANPWRHGNPVPSWRSMAKHGESMAKAIKVDCSGLHMTILNKHYANTLPIKDRKVLVFMIMCQTSWIVRRWRTMRQSTFEKTFD